MEKRQMKKAAQSGGAGSEREHDETDNAVTHANGDERENDSGHDADVFHAITSLPRLYHIGGENATEKGAEEMARQTFGSATEIMDILDYVQIVEGGQVVAEGNWWEDALAAYWDMRGVLTGGHQRGWTFTIT